jgi:hypothetical protein
MNRRQSHTCVAFARALLAVGVPLLGVSARPCSGSMPPELRNTIDALAVPMPQVSNTRYAMKLDLRVFTLEAVKAEIVEHRGRRAIHLADVRSSQTTDLDSMAVLNDSDFQDGTIELQIAGTPRPGEFPDARGFVGIAFRVNADVSRYEYIYLRPTNGRADDQVRRNHSTQYASEPGYPWPVMRKENPNLYESYVDLEPDVWTKFKLVVAGRRAELYINGAQQPCLIVKDLKQGETRGKIALWVGLAADGYFSDLTVTPARPEKR